MSDFQTAKLKLKDVPHKPGVYLHKDRLGSIIYVGKARDLRKRLSNYFAPSRKMKADRKTRALIDTIADFEIHEVKNEQEALLLEGKLIKQYRPRYNVSFRDDKRFLLVKIRLTDEWPRFQTTRLKKEDGSKYFGPFAQSGALKETIVWLNREFALRTCRTTVPTEKDYKHCNADVIRNCSAPCIQKISREDYLKNIQDACELLEGKGRRDRLKSLEEEMALAAANLDFEKAAKLRDVVQNLKKTLSPTRQFSRGRGVPTTVQPTDDLSELADILGLEAPPTVMECFDISNISSNHIVASMVRFKNGLPDNQNYRRYRIKTVKGQDDFASMAEVVRRRYSRLIREGKAKATDDLEYNQEDVADLAKRVRVNLPQLIIVDGGKGQLSSAYRELKALGLSGQPIIGLAKREEEIFRPGESNPIIIPHDRGALKILQRIRDEAHRFANGYNELLLRKRMKESILDDCPGVSQRRKETLLKEFGSVERIRNASALQIANIPGISEKGAQSILDWLAKHLG